MTNQQEAHTAVLGEAHLYDELFSFPLRLSELTELCDESYSCTLSSKPYDRDRVSRGSKFCGASPVERIVVRILTHPYFLELQAFVACIEFLHDSASPADKKLLQSFWRGEPLSFPFPQRLLYRYSALKKEYHVTTVAFEEAAAARKNAPTAA